VGSFFFFVFFLFIYLLAYHSCTGGILWPLQKCLQYIFIKINPLHLSLLSLLPPSQVSLFHFHTWIHNISTIFALLYPFLMPSPLSLIPIPG
jgi:hypothetical protein